MRPTSSRGSRGRMIDYGHFHAVRFYENQTSLCRIVATFLREGFALGQPGLVIATREHSRGILAELRARDLFAETLVESGDLVLVDAAHALASFMDGGVPNPEKFLQVTTAALERVRRGRKGVTVRAYGEMVDV